MISICATRFAEHAFNQQYATVSTGANIRRFRKSRGWTILQLANAVDSDVGNISRLERDVQGYSKEMLKKIAEALGVKVSDLFDDDSNIELEPELVDFVPVRRCTLQLSAGITGFAIQYENHDQPPIYFRKDWLTGRGIRPESLVAVKVSGQSMEPGLFDGDMVVVHTADHIAVDGEVYAVNFEGELVIKRLKRDGGEWWLASDNADKSRYPDKRCNDGVFLVGRVIHKQSERI